MNRSLQIFFIDNFDSFTFNLVDEFQKRGACVQVWRNDLDPERACRMVRDLPTPCLVVFSPGPGGPREAGSCLAITKKLAGSIPLFGVCLGHQILIEALGGRVDRAEQVLHGKSSPVKHDGRGIFSGLPNPLLAGRYHSLAAVETGPDFRVSAWCDRLIMAVEHNEMPVIGLQFHPESILTPRGGSLIENVVTWAGDWFSKTSEAKKPQESTF